MNNKYIIIIINTLLWQHCSATMFRSSLLDRFSTLAWYDRDLSLYRFMNYCALILSHESHRNEERDDRIDRCPICVRKRFFSYMSVKRFLIVHRTCTTQDYSVSDAGSRGAVACIVRTDGKVTCGTRCSRSRTRRIPSWGPFAAIGRSRVTSLLVMRYSTWPCS